MVRVLLSLFPEATHPSSPGERRLFRRASKESGEGRGSVDTSPPPILPKGSASQMEKSTWGPSEDHPPLCEPLHRGTPEGSLYGGHNLSVSCAPAPQEAGEGGHGEVRNATALVGFQIPSPAILEPASASSLYMFHAHAKCGTTAPILFHTARLVGCWLGRRGAAVHHIWLDPGREAALKKCASKMAPTSREQELAERPCASPLLPGVAGRKGKVVCVCEGSPDPPSRIWGKVPTFLQLLIFLQLRL